MGFRRRWPHGHTGRVAGQPGLLGLGGSASLVASMGASAVLLFAVPHGPLSQPWAVFGGHLVSAVIGVACVKLNVHHLLASALAVALAISAMHYMRCIHPPGGATALTAVAGGDAVHALGFNYVLTPVLLNVCVILLVAMVFNWPFPWRRYPAVWAQTQHRPATAVASGQRDERFSREELASAASNLYQSLGINQDMLDTLASGNSESGTLHPADICIGRYYSNGEFGPLWQVRQVIGDTNMEAAETSMNATVTYRIVAGHKRRQKVSSSRQEFANWARYEVYRNENSWQRIDTKMKRNSVKRVVVCDDDRRVLGMVTRSDLVQIFFDRYTQTSPV
jgi:CBS domain-containing membrane protein